MQHCPIFNDPLQTFLTKRSVSFIFTSVSAVVQLIIYHVFKVISTCIILLTGTSALGQAWASALAVAEGTSKDCQQSTASPDETNKRFYLQFQLLLIKTSSVSCSVILPLSGKSSSSSSSSSSLSSPGGMNMSVGSSCRSRRFIFLFSSPWMLDCRLTWCISSDTASSNTDTWRTDSVISAMPLHWSISDSCLCNNRLMASVGCWQARYETCNTSNTSFPLWQPLMSSILHGHNNKAWFVTK